MAGEYAIIDEAQRSMPDAATIAAIRARYPVEAEIDAVLTRKMQRRHGPGYAPIALERLVDGIKALIEARVGYQVAVNDARWLSGGASKLQVLFDLHWRGPSYDASQVDRLVLRMEPSASVTESSRYREFEVLRAVEGVIPSPKAFWVDGEGEFLPWPAMIYGFVSGAAKPSYDAGKVTGLGQNYGPELRAKLFPDFAGLLGKLHRIDVAATPGLEHFERPEVGSNTAVIKRVNALRRVWEEDRIEEEPVLEIVYRWLVSNAPPLDHISIVHGDYRSGNFLFDEGSGQITAWLDWEGASLGDRHQDLTYAALPVFSHLDEDGVTQLASGLAPTEAFYAAYARASGLSVDPVRLSYYAVFNRYLVAVLCLAGAARLASKRHASGCSGQFHHSARPRPPGGAAQSVCGDGTMNLDLDAQLQVSLRALQEVVLPALAGSEKHVIEQLHLAMMTIGFVRTRLPDARAYARMELAAFLNLSEQSIICAGTAPQLAAAANSGRAVLASAESDTADIIQAARHLRDAVAALASQCTDNRVRDQLDRLVLDASGPLISQARRWACPFGFELNPEDLPAPLWGE